MFCLLCIMLFHAWLCSVVCTVSLTQYTLNFAKGYM